MCNWCKKKTIGVPQISGHFLPLICEHCGTKQKTILNHSNCIEWAKNINDEYNEIARRDFERKIYEQCDKENRGEK